MPASVKSFVCGFCKLLIILLIISTLPGATYHGSPNSGTNLNSLKIILSYKKARLAVVQLVGFDDSLAQVGLPIPHEFYLAG